MLVDYEFVFPLEPQHVEAERPTDRLWDGIDFEMSCPARLEQGVYFVPEGIDNWLRNEFDEDWQHYPADLPTPLYCYGVCDSATQFRVCWLPLLLQSNRKFLVVLGHLHKIDEPVQGGWRWHKWGPYIGTKQPRHEYLYDEGPEITRVCLFQIYEYLNV